MGSDLGTTASRICSGGCGGAQMEMKANDRRRVAGAEAAARMHLDHWVHLDKQRTPSCLLWCASLKFEVSFSNSFKAWRTRLGSMGRSIGCSTNCRAKLQHIWWPVGCSSKLHSCSLGVERLEILEESDQRVADLLEDQKG
nr:uncharacterized protein LOC4348598 isoform X2 [Oryza sativa Japonica Group]